MNQQSKVKILTGWSDKGGSTTTLIALTNQLNKQGIDTTMYGPHDWHLDKCKSGKLDNNLSIDESDVLICHFLQLKSRPKAKKVILACHEKWWFMVGEVQQYWDVAVFLHEEHKKYHSLYTGESVIIPNLKPNLKQSQIKPDIKTGGVIGTIEDRKQTHKSIIKAINDGCQKVYVFGQISDKDYYDKYVSHLIDGDLVEMVGYHNDKQVMYDSITDVYHSSKGEVACLVKDECYLTGTTFHGNEETNNIVSELTNNDIITLWENLIR